MDELRDRFEKIAYENKWNIFRVRDMGLDHYVDEFVDGAWWGFKEQQIKLDAIKKKLSDIYDACDEYKTVGHLLDEIQEILK